MTEYRKDRGAGDLYKQYKVIGVHPVTGESVYAEMFSLDAGSIGGGGGGVASSVTVADGVTPTQLLAVDASGRITANISGTIPVSGTFWQATQPVSGTFFQATQPVSGTFWQATQPVSLATNTPDVTDRAARLLGHVTVDSAPTTAVTGTFWQATQPVSGTFFQATQPVSLATNTPDVTDRAARLLGHVTVDNASLAVTGTFFQATQPVSGTVTANQGGAPWSENLTQVGGTAITLKAVPTNADGQASLPTTVNAIQYATYDAGARNIATGALTANTAKAVMSFEHALASTKTVRLRRIMIHAIQTTALSGSVDVQITKGTAASSAGTAVTPNPRKGGDAAAECVVKTLPTIVAATVADNIPALGFGATTALYSPPVLVYDWQEAGETKPYMLRAGVLESLVINVVSTAAHNLTLTVSVDFTEE